MRDWAALRERYLRDKLPVRLGGLAANLARVRSFADHPAHGEVVEALLEESKFLVEWSAPEVEAESQAELVELQIILVRWQRAWSSIWVDPERRAAVAEQAGAWSERVLEMSGLLRRG
jgi:broad specificity phosphatase PhoE